MYIKRARKLDNPAIMSTICIGNPNLKHTVESRFFEPPGEKGIGLNYLGV